MLEVSGISGADWGGEDWRSAVFASRKFILAAVSLETGPDARQGSASYELCAPGHITSPSEPQCPHLSNAVGRSKINIYSRTKHLDYNWLRGRESGCEPAPAT